MTSMANSLTLARFWWLRLPVAARKVSSRLTDVLTDGVYWIQWPVVAAVGPVIALLTGLLIGWLHPGDTFTFSIVLLLLMLLVGSFGAALGLWTWCGYVLGDCFLHSHVIYAEPSIITFWIPLLIADILLGMLLIAIPLTTKGLRLKTRAELKPYFKMPVWMNVALHAAIQAALVYLWVECVPTLIRPLYVWQNGSPPYDAIHPIQSEGYWLVGAAALGGGIRLILEYRASSRHAVIEHIKNLQNSLLKTGNRGRSKLPLWGKVSLKAAFVTLMLSGMFLQWLEAFEMAVFIAGAMFLRVFLSSRLGPWVRLVSRVPLLLRFVIAAGVAYLLSSFIVGALWNSVNSFQPIILSVALSLLLLVFLLPETTLAGSPGRTAGVAS